MYPEDKLHLRYTSALEEKYRKLKGYRDEGIVSPADALVIAVFQGGILDADLHDVTLPSIAKVLFGLGEEYLEVNPYSNRAPKPGIKRRLHIEKSNKANVPAAFFHDPKTEIVSAVLQGDTFMRSEWAAKDSLTMIHRQGASVRIPLEALPARCEMWVDPSTDLLEFKGRCARHGFYSGEEGKAATDLLGWSFEVNERSAGVYEATGTDSHGHRVQSTGTDCDALLKECHDLAAQVEASSRRR